jgi:hypothetical protein
MSIVIDSRRRRRVTEEAKDSSRGFEKTRHTMSTQDNKKYSSNKK